MLSVTEKFSWLKETLKSLSSVLEIESEKEIGFRIYDELDIDIHSALCDTNLKVFVNQNLITSETSKELARLRNQTLKLIKQRLEPDQIKLNESWIDISKVSEQIYVSINNRSAL